MTTITKFEENVCSSSTEIKTVIQIQHFKYLKPSHINNVEELFLKNVKRPLPDFIFKDDFYNDITLVKQYYEMKNWLCGCETRNALFCYPCLLMGGEQLWTERGISSIHKLNDKIAKHEKLADHINNGVALALLKQLHNKHRKDSNTVIKDNDKMVPYNDNKILNELIECIIYCRHLIIPLHEFNNDTNYLTIQNQFNELINIAIKSHYVKENLKDNKTFQRLRSNMTDYLFKVYQNEIIEDVKKTSFVAVIIDDITDVTEHYQMVIILRYLLNNKLIERFWGFFTPTDKTVKSISQIIIEQLNIIFQDMKEKLIAQTFDGAIFMNRIKKTIQTNVKKFYNNAHFVNCYVHQPNLIMKNIASITNNSKISYSCINAISTFFLKSPQYLNILHKHVNISNSLPPNKRWKFNIDTVKQVYEYLEPLRDCFNEILSTSNNDQIIAETTGILHYLNNKKFLFWLELYNQIMPHIDKIYNQMLSPTINVFQVNDYIKNFKNNIYIIKNSEYCKNFVNELIIEAKEVCNCLCTDIQHRNHFHKHLAAATLFDKNNIEQFKNKFPMKEMKLIIEAYPMINKDKFKTELQIFYDNDSMHHYNQLYDLYEFIIDNDLHHILSEITTIIEILLTTPMLTTETKRCFSTLQKIKEFLRTNVYYENLNAMTMMVIDKRFLLNKSTIKDDVIAHLFHQIQGSNKGVIFKC